MNFCIIIIIKVIAASDKFILASLFSLYVTELEEKILNSDKNARRLEIDIVPTLSFGLLQKA